MAELWASTGAIWRDMLLAEALVFVFSLSCVSRLLNKRVHYDDDNDLEVVRGVWQHDHQSVRNSVDDQQHVWMRYSHKRHKAVCRSLH